MNLRKLLNPINILILGKSFQDYLKNLLIDALELQKFMIKFEKCPK